MVRFTEQRGVTPPEPDYGPRPLIDREEISWVVYGIALIFAGIGVSFWLGLCAGIAVWAFRLAAGG